MCDVRDLETSTNAMRVLRERTKALAVGPLGVELRNSWRRMRKQVKECIMLKTIGVMEFLTEGKKV